MSKRWRSWAILWLATAVSAVPAQSPPVPESVYPPQQQGRPGPKGGQRGGGGGLDALENSLPTQNTLSLEDDSGNAFCDPGHEREEEPFLVWFKGEGLQWMFPSQSLAAPLVTTVEPRTLIDTVAETAIGGIGQPGTVVLFGNQTFSLDQVNGGRVTVGANAGGLPIELSAFWLNDSAVLFDARTDGQPGSPVLARPVFRTNPAAETAFFVGPFQSPSTTPAPGWGGAVVVETNANLWGIEALGFLPVGASDTLFFDTLFGFRYNDLNEGVQIRNFKSSVGAQPISFNGNNAIPAGFTTIATDDFSARNQIAALQVGARSILGLRRLGLMFDAKLAVGANFQELSIAGNSTLVSPGSGVRGTTTVPGGILAVASNSGDFTDTNFTIMPEVAATAIFKLHRNVRIFATYSALYMNNIVRPGNHLDSAVDTRQVPTSDDFIAGFTGDAPLPRFVETDFFVHGLSLGVWVGF